MALDLSKVNTYSIDDRDSKVHINDFIDVTKISTNIMFDDIDKVADIMSNLRYKKKVVLAMGAHVIKTGCSTIIIDLIKRGYISAVAMNGAGMIHDMEIAHFGRTSESVENGIVDGSFGFVKETPELVARASYFDSFGYGGGSIANTGKFNDYSIMAACYEADIPCCVFAAIGTDIIYMHPIVDASAIGRASHQDFKILGSVLSGLNGGIWLNVGSAVILPEVFLKLVSLVRNLGHDISNLTSANFDMIDHYRNRNVITRPVLTGYNIIGRHEETLPTLYNLLVSKNKK
jgi:hypothetical protein